MHPPDSFFKKITPITRKQTRLCFRLMKENACSYTETELTVPRASRPQVLPPASAYPHLLARTKILKTIEANQPPFADIISWARTFSCTAQCSLKAGLHGWDHERGCSIVFSTALWNESVSPHTWKLVYQIRSLLWYTDILRERRVCLLFKKRIRWANKKSPVYSWYSQCTCSSLEIPKSSLSFTHQQ